MRKILKKVLVSTMILSIIMSGMTMQGKMSQVKAADDAFEKSISDFPSSYKTYLRKLHEKYPKWKFEALETGLRWDDVVSGETDPEKSGSGNKALVAKTAGDLLKRNLACDYNPSTGNYIYKDASSWVSAGQNTIAYFLDPRNFLNEVNVFQFEKNSYDKSVHTLSGVKKILAGTFMDYGKGDFSYINTKGKTVKAGTTYAEEIFKAGKKYGVSPYYLASKIVQEVGSNGSGSTNGKYTSKDGKTTFTGYYNFYNIGANDGADPIKNGLNYSKSAGWTTPMASIAGGAEFFNNKYISGYQNTGYFVRFNVDSRSPYALYTHQFMTNISGAAQETSTTYNAYESMGVLSEAKVFLIPVYKNMPASSNTVTITSAKNKTGVLTGNANIRKGPGTSYDAVETLNKGTKVTILSGELAGDNGYSYDNLKNPYWYKINYTSGGGTKTGYISTTLLDISINKSIVLKDTYKVRVSLKDTSDTVYYLSSNPAIATVSKSGDVTAKKRGEVTIYAILGNGRMDAIKLQVVSMTLSPVSKTIIAGKSFALKATVSSGDSVKFTSSNTKVATVNSNGVVKGKNTGKVTITARSASGASRSSTVIVKPSKRELIVSKHSYNYATLSWNRARYASGYEVYRKKSTDRKYKKVVTLKGSTKTKYKDTDVINGATYMYRVRAYKTIGGKKYYSAYATLVYKIRPAKVSVKAQEVSPSKRIIKIKWTKRSYVTGYVIYRKIGTKGKYKKIAVIKNPKTTSYIDRKLKKNKTYYYKMKTYKKNKNKNVYSVYSNTRKIVLNKK